jgi:glycosyltransferase involved in cell wall biosynthesis
MAALARVVAGGFGARRGPIYLSAAGGRGLLYNVTLAAGARVLKRPLYIHHHSFAYVDRWDWKMSLLVRVAGARARHLVLCPMMAAGLRRNYRQSSAMHVVSNAAFYRPPAKEVAPRESSRPLRLGFLSNLSRDKGLDLVIETAVTAGDMVAGLTLAGAPMDGEARAMIDGAGTKLGPRLDYRGAVQGEDKARFFADIDVFLFPSRYINEAEPTVVYEALSAGVPVIAYGRGCVRCQVPEGAGLVVATGDDFVAAACAQIARWSRDPAAWTRASHQAIAETRKAYERARAGLMDLVSALSTARG